MFRSHGIHSYSYAVYLFTKKTPIMHTSEQAESGTGNLKLIFAQNNFVMTFVVASFGFKVKQSFKMCQHKCSY